MSISRFQGAALATANLTTPGSLGGGRRGAPEMELFALCAKEQILSNIGRDARFRKPDPVCLLSSHHETGLALPQELLSADGLEQHGRARREAAARPVAVFQNRGTSLRLWDAPSVSVTCPICPFSGPQEFLPF